MSSREPPSRAAPGPPHGYDRQHRQNNTFLILIALVLVIGLVALGSWMQWWGLGGKPAEAAPVLCPVQKVSDPALTKVNVYNGTTRRGLAATVARELQHRRFRVLAIATKTQDKPIKAVAVIRYGPPGGVAAHTVALQFPAKVIMVKDARDSRIVDVILGQKYHAMVARAKAAAAIAPVPDPAGCIRPTSTAAATP